MHVLSKLFILEPIGTENDGDMPIVYVGRQNEEGNK